MTSPNKPSSKPSRVAKMSVKPIWRKKLNHCNTSNRLNVNLPTPMPKPLTPHHEPSQENNHPNQALPNPYIKDTPISPHVISHPSFPISLINSHVTHTQASPQSDNQTPYIKDTQTLKQVVSQPPLPISHINSHCPKDSPFDLEAYSDSDYAGTSLDMKSTTGGCQFLRSRLILWQCKKQIVVANSTTEAEYVATSN
ncbi:hydroxyphenylpyruvate reductase [Tanacetum coccineum]